MRKALNENPMVQVGALALLALLVVVVFMTRMGGGEPATEEATGSTEAAAPAAATAPVPDSEAPAPTTPVTEGTPATAAPFEAGKGLPAPVVKAHESGDVVVLYLMQEKGIEDELVKKHVELLRDRKDTTVFVSEVKDVSRYSRIAGGVSLNRVPAIVVLTPLQGKLPKGETAPIPTATVSYGFRGNASVIQTVRDALYQGKQLGYDPG
ncbi:MAG TPA: hypothetical protein VD766_02780 [Solirubrobacterales bacterium]|nr:hypothetical protein [Solirubrobacterales bacterium]